MHRSGTSLAARLLAERGVFLGSDEDLLPPTPENPDGYWEHRAVRELHDDLLERLGGSWDAPPRPAVGWADGDDVADLRARARRIGESLERSGPWGWKDPRGCLTLPLWRALYPSLRVVHCVRNPLEAAWSLERTRHALPESLGLELWMRYVDAVSEAGLAADTITTHFEALLFDPSAETARLAAWLGLPPSAQGALTAGRARRHQFATTAMVGTLAPAAVAQRYAELLREAGGVYDTMSRDDAYARAQLEAVLARSVERVRGIERWFGRDTAEERRLAGRVARLRADLVSLHGSRLLAVCRRVWGVRDALAPRGSRRRRVLARVRGWLAGPLGESATGDASPHALRRAARSLSASSDDALWVLGDPHYGAHRARTEPDAEDLRQQRARARAARVTAEPLELFSVAPASADGVRALWASLEQQTHEAWRWHVLVRGTGSHGLAGGDPRLSVSTDPAAFVRSLRGLGSRRIVVLDADGRLPPWALYRLAEALEEHPEADLVYADHDRVDEEGIRHAPCFKPDWSPEAVFSTDLLFPLTACRADLVAGRPPDREVCWRCWLRGVRLELTRQVRDVRHVPAVLCHVAPSQAAHLPGCSPALRDAVAGVLRAGGVDDPEVRDDGAGGFRVRWRPRTRLVSIVIPTRDQGALLRACVESIGRHSRGLAHELVVVDNDTREAAARDVLDGLAGAPNARVVPMPGEFNFGAACNAGARAASGDVLLFLNNDVEIGQHDWLERLAQWLDLPGVGAVGPKLLFPDGHIQHAGVVMGMGGLAGHVFHGAVEHSVSPWGGDDVYRNVSAVTAACLMLPRVVFEELAGFDEGYRLTYSDVDLCLRLRDLGHRIVYTPEARLTHHESQSRKKVVYRTDFERITRALRARGMADDPYFNPSLSYCEMFPTFNHGVWDHPRLLNRDVMGRLPDRPVFSVPDDLR